MCRFARASSRAQGKSQVQRRGVSMSTVGLPVINEALQSWKAACARLEQAIHRVTEQAHRADDELSEEFGLALRALYNLEGAFFPDLGFTDDLPPAAS